MAIISEGSIKPRLPATITPTTLAPPSGLSTNVFVPPPGVKYSGPPLVGPAPDITISREEVLRHIPEEYRSGTTILQPPSGEGISGQTTIRTLYLSDAERQQLATLRGQATCVADARKLEPRIFKATLKGGGYILVEDTSDKKAKARAIEAGYKVAWVTWSPKYEVPKVEPTTALVPEDSVVVHDAESNQDLIIAKNDWNALSDRYKGILTGQSLNDQGRNGYPAMQWQMTRDFEVSNTRLADGRWMANTDFKDLQKYDQENGTDYAEVAKTRGYTALLIHMGIDTAARETATNTMAHYKTEDGYNLLAAAVDQVPASTMKTAGFKDEDIQQAQNIYNTSVKTGVALPDNVSWVNPTTGKQYTDAEYRKLIADYDTQVRATVGTPAFYELGPNPRDVIRLSDKSARRLIIEGTSMFVFQPARALLPEVGVKDISKLEWVIGGAQLATWLMPVIPAKAIPAVSGVAAGVFGYTTAKSWANLSPTEKVLGVGGTVLVALPVLLAAASKIRPAAGGKSTATLRFNPEQQHAILDRIVGFSRETPIDKLKATAKTKVDAAYIDMGIEFSRYSHTELALKQVQKTISDFGLAKSKGQLSYLNKLKAAEGKLAAQLDDFKGSLTKKAQNYSDAFLDSPARFDLSESQILEVSDLSKRVTIDSDALTTQLFGTRDALTIASDIKELKGQIATIEAETKRGMPAGQVREYNKLVQTLTTQIEDLNRELRIRNLLGEEVTAQGQNLVMETASLQQRLTKAIEQAESFKGTAQEYPIYRKGELATRAQVLKMERDTMEAIQKTTEAIWGNESYASVLEKLNGQLDDVITAMRKAGVKTDKAGKASFEIYDAIVKQDTKALKAAIEKLQLEAGRIPDKPLQVQAQAKVNSLRQGLMAKDIWKRLVKQRGDEFQKLQNDLTSHEKYREYVQKIRDKTTDPKRQETLEQHITELERQIQKKKLALKEAVKTDVVSRTRILTEAELQKMKIAKVGEKALVTSKQAAQERMARAAAEEKAAKLIRATKKGTAKAPQKVTPKPYKGGFPGITPKTAAQKRAGQVSQKVFEAELANLTRTMTVHQAVKVLAEQGATDPSLGSALEAGLLASTKSQTKGATKTQTKQAIQTAVQTQLKLATKTLPEPQLKTATDIITDIVIRTPTITTTTMPPAPPPPPWRPPRGLVSIQPEKKLIREGPALAVWKQGRYWVSIFPPFRTTGRKEDVVYSLTKPPWGSVIARGRHAPKKTLRSMGKIPELIVVPMGVVTARIRNGRTLTFSRRDGHRRRGRVLRG